MDDGASDASSSGLPPPLISSDDYDAFVCRACVMTIPTLQRAVGTPGAITVVRNDVNSPWKRLGDDSKEDAPVVIANTDAPSASAGDKRPPLPPADEPAAKRARTASASSSAAKPCLAPPVEPTAQAAYTTAELDWDTALCTGDVFLTEKFRERWCRCDSVRSTPFINGLYTAHPPQCLSSLEAHPYLLEEEETYEPPEDPDSGIYLSYDESPADSITPTGLSLEELGMRALERLPRDRAIDGILAFNAMRSVGSYSVTLPTQLFMPPCL
jgi:E3 ubiquitin-protein ligase UBR7